MALDFNTNAVQVICCQNFVLCIESVCCFFCYFWQFILTPGPAEELPVKVLPLVAAIRSNRYVHVKELYIWDMPMKHEDIATLVCNHCVNMHCLWIESGFTCIVYLLTRQPWAECSSRFTQNFFFCLVFVSTDSNLDSANFESRNL